MPYRLDVHYRKQTLIKLLNNIQSNEEALIQALYADFKKPAFEVVATETSYIEAELKYTLKNMEKWAKPKWVLPSFLNFPSSDFIYKEPYGKVLIIAPWNYPYQLALSPLIAAVAAGNQVVVKPSELTLNTSAVITRIIRSTFDETHVACIEGGVEEAQALLTQRWDYIFFTGSSSVGKLVAQAAAKHLTPVTLELGGKNPCIIDASANLKLAAKRIVWGKFMNAGQTCIAPDYLLIAETVKETFVSYLKSEILSAFGEHPKVSPDYGRIVNEKNWRRLVALLENEAVLYGGESTLADCYIAPTLLDESQLDSLVMQEEIFGPILPIISYRTEEELGTYILHYEKPLALYVFTTNTTFAEKMITHYSFGGGCINDTLVQFTNKRLPFGGIGHSGIGAYHGACSFALFSHHKSIVKKGNWLDIPTRYAPYQGKIKLIKKVMGWFS
jgi:aldehyde dehydrogenase (NAD+)